MALFSMRVQPISRGDGRSVIAAAAYRAGEKLCEERTGRIHNYSQRSGVERTEIMLPVNAPAWVCGLSREAFWNAVDAAEKRKDAQTAREIRIAIPREIGHDDRITLVRDFVTQSFTSRGMVADVCWHNKVASDGKEQPHAHIMLTTRFLEDGGFGKKSRHEMILDPEGRTRPDGTRLRVPDNPDSWNLDSYYETCRASWEALANQALERAGSEARIDRRSYLERGIARLPEPALRFAWYMKDLYGVMRERFGQFQAARHFREVEERAATGLEKAAQSPSAGEQVRKSERFFGWIERQIERLAPDRTEGARPLPNGSEIDR